VALFEARSGIGRSHGVIVGAAATGGMNGWLAWLAARRERRRGFGQAIGDLHASAHALIITMNVALAERTPPELRTAWLQTLTVHAEAVIRASKLIRRLSPGTALADTAEAWSDAAVTYLDPASAGITASVARQRAEDARDAFQAAARRRQNSTSR
jgi:hypothetical protein